MKEMLNAKEAAEYLDIHEKQLYRLTKDRKIPATKLTGKWLFPKALIDECIMKSAKERVGIPFNEGVSENQVVIAGTNDPALELLIRNTNLQNPRYSVLLISNMGSVAGLSALQRRNCHAAACNLLDLETGKYNSTFIKMTFPELNVVILNLAYREQGLLLKTGNPLGIKTLGDVVTKKGAFVNRQKGSGTGVLVDHCLRKSGIDPAAICGYNKIAHTHMEVALEIFGGRADAGIGIHAAAKMFNLGFIPLATERFDLIIRSEDLNGRAIKALQNVLASKEFKCAITRMGGYETGKTGKIMSERE